MSIDLERDRRSGRDEAAESQALKRELRWLRALVAAKEKRIRALETSYSYRFGHALALAVTVPIRGWRWARRALGSTRWLWFLPVLLGSGVTSTRLLALLRRRDPEGVRRLLREAGRETAGRVVRKMLRHLLDWRRYAEAGFLAHAAGTLVLPTTDLDLVENLAEALMASGFTSQADRLLEQALLLAPRDAGIARRYATSAAEQWHDSGIFRRSEVAVAIDDPAPGVVEHLAAAGIRTNRPDRSREVLYRFFDRLSLGGQRQAMYLEFYLDRDPQGVIDLVDTLPEEVRRRPELAAHRALAESDLGRHDEAERTLGAPTDPNTAVTLYEIRRARGDAAGALAAWNGHLVANGLAPLSRSWKEAGFPLEDLTCDPLPPSGDRRLVTVVMTAHRWHPMMSTAVRSVLEQTHRNLELLIVDDASPDPEPYAELATDPRVRVLRQAENAGTYAGRNRGLWEAQGEIVTFIDSDDWCHPQSLEHALGMLDSAPRAVMALHSYARLYADGSLARIGGFFVRRALMAMTFRIGVLRDELGGFDPVRVSADAELLERTTAAYGKAAVLHRPLLTYVATHHDRSLTGGGPLAIDWRGPRGPRAEYTAAFRGWHRRCLALGSPLRLDPSRPAPFPAPEAMARRGAAGNGKGAGGPRPLEPFYLEAAANASARRRCADGPVTVCMASFQGRRAMIGATVECLLDQTRPPDRVLIHWNAAGDPPPLPADRRIELHLSPRDLTDIGKFRMAGRVEEGYVLTVDDDLVYPRDYVETLLAGIERHRRRAVVGIHGVVLPLGAAVRTWQAYRSQRRVHSFRHGLAVDLPVHLVGTGTAGYHVDTLRVDWTAFNHGRMADLHLAVLAQERGVPMVCLARPHGWLRDADVTSDNAIWSDALDDEDLQRQMLEVLARCPDWALHRPGLPAIRAADLDLVVPARDFPPR